MAEANKNFGETTSETYEQIEKARKRIRQKKLLYYHFVVFIIGSLFLVIINKLLKVKEEWNWYIWAITFWAFLLAIHTFNVFVTQKFLGKEWEEKQRRKLIEQQKARIEKIKQEVAQQFPLPGPPKDPSSQ